VNFEHQARKIIKHNHLIAAQNQSVVKIEAVFRIER